MSDLETATSIFLSCIGCWSESLVSESLRPVLKFTESFQCFSCDFGYTGLTCGETVAPNPTVLVENFEGPNLLRSTAIEEIKGALLGYECDVLSTGKAVVFNQDGRRELITGELNTTNNM